MDKQNRTALAQTSRHDNAQSSMPEHVVTDAESQDIFGHSLTIPRERLWNRNVVAQLGSAI